MARRLMARSGKALRGSLGVARHFAAGRGTDRLGAAVMVPQVMAVRGMARPVTAW